jgi:hypothetical protein
MQSVWDSHRIQLPPKEIYNREKISASCINLTQQKTKSQHQHTRTPPIQQQQQQQQTQEPIINPENVVEKIE